MPRVFGICLVMIGAAGFGSVARPGAQPGDFSLILERAGTRWVATCERGCEFQQVSTTTRDVAMPMRVDAHGLRTLAADYAEASTFAFTVVARGRGWEATSVAGTAWSALAFECGQEPCRSRVTDLGVMSVALPR